MIVVATEEELELAKKRFKNQKIVKTGVGGINVIESLKRYNKATKITNFGYAGSNNLPIGKEVTIGSCRLYHPNVEYEEPTYELPGTTKCYTSNDFVTSTNIKEDCVFDMELAYICSMFKNVQAIKIISDNLSMKQYESKIKGE